MMFPKSNPVDLNRFYGDPDKGDDGLPDIVWESANLIECPPPYPMVLAWNQRPLRVMRLHKKCAANFLRALRGVGEAFTAEERRAFQLDQFGGAYNFRLMRGSNRLSVHSWGAAIDLAPERNGLGKNWDPKRGMMPIRVVEIFASEGIRWGGLWSRPDAMHFEATSK